MVMRKGIKERSDWRKGRERGTGKNLRKLQEMEGVERER
jgi:hypothetical protein